MALRVFGKELVKLMNQLIRIRAVGRARFLQRFSGSMRAIEAVHAKLHKNPGRALIGAKNFTDRHRLFNRHNNRSFPL